MKQPFPEADAFPNAPGLSKDLGLTQAPAQPFPRFIDRDGVRYRWYSICSAHGGPGAGDPNPDCECCRMGSYRRQEETGDTWEQPPAPTNPEPIANAAGEIERLKGLVYAGLRPAGERGSFEAVGALNTLATLAKSPAPTPAATEPTPEASRKDGR